MWLNLIAMAIGYMKHFENAVNSAHPNDEALNRIIVRWAIKDLKCDLSTVTYVYRKISQLFYTS